MTALGLLTTALLAAGFAGSADPPTGLRVATFIASSMVLPREPHSARVWGWAKPGARIWVTLPTPGIAVTVTADGGGAWVAALPPQSASTSGQLLTVSDGSTKITLYDVLFGDVWLCSGQSNMEFSVNGAFNATAEIADAARYVNLRMATTQKQASDYPKDDVRHRGPAAWLATSDAKAFYTPPSGSPSFSDVFMWPSAVCYFFARHVYVANGGKVPIGMVGSDWGGQSVQSFSSPDALADVTCGGTVPASTGHAASAPSPPAYAQPDSDPEPNPVPNPEPTQLWNGLIYPLLNFRFAGAVWYQARRDLLPRCAAERPRLQLERLRASAG